LFQVHASALRVYGFVITVKRSGRSRAWYYKIDIKRSLAMKKLLVVTSFAALAAYPAAACDWNREASAKDPVVAATATTTEQTPQAAPASPQATSVAVDESARKPIDEPAPVVLVTDRH
jgi:hypothetical protein